MGKVCSVLSGREANVDIGVIAPVLNDLAKAAGLPGLPVHAEAHQTATRQVTLTGRKKSLFIGCNYVGTENELHGCANDVKRMLPALANLGFSSDAESQQVLLDTGSAQETKPTRANMLKAMEWLVRDARPGDALFFHYSGHGGREPAQGTSDGYHETLVPLDFQTAGMLKDTDLFDVLVKPLPSGCRLTCVLDSCHSAGALNLPFRFVGTKDDLVKGLAGEAVHMFMSHSWAKDVQQWKAGNKLDMLKDIGAMGVGLWHLRQSGKDAEGGNSTGFTVEEEQNKDLHVGEVVAFTGCRSDQTSADVGDVNQQFHLKAVGGNSRGSLVIDSSRAARASDAAGGALTTALLESLQNMVSQNLSYLELLEQIRKELASKGFSQVPQVVTSLVVDLKDNFALDSVSIPIEAGGATQNAQPPSVKESVPAQADSEDDANPLAFFMSALAGHPQGEALLQQGELQQQGAPMFKNYM